MDVRTTLSVNESFMEMLTDIKNRGAKAEMILDINGLERAQGVIQEIHADDPNPYIELTDGTKIAEKTIAALNGIFRPEYSGC
ncbi:MULTISPECIES: hypothetical protein [Dyadobacter]|uniref:Rho-binding antiterminator n=1 Tax=Dyadobacter chenhuakuii TaxID=2909339 RepID=A0ABY4XH19_9BACT|nr:MULTISPECIES: hypothetical protein [Dyadobacter]MCF2495415.1 hypothetical protein [Dyadobacter chenhuakuii]MCF2521123.1 hypothetical protein [Dyadobacter sp. CY351]USJ29453.1 hypothetical protein NFI80_16390 [Dyadobacter chenhuakuii]